MWESMYRYCVNNTLNFSTGIPDPEEFDLVRNDGELKGDQIDGTATLPKKHGILNPSNINPLNFPTLVREKDIKRMQKLRQKVATDDNSEYFKSKFIASGIIGDVIKAFFYNVFYSSNALLCDSCMDKPSADFAGSRHRRR